MVYYCDHSIDQCDVSRLAESPSIFKIVARTSCGIAAMELILELRHKNMGAL